MDAGSKDALQVQYFARGRDAGSEDSTPALQTVAFYHGKVLRPDSEATYSLNESTDFIYFLTQL